MAFESDIHLRKIKKDLQSDIFNVYSLLTNEVSHVGLL